MDVKSVGDVIEFLISQESLEKAARIWSIRKAFEEAAGKELSKSLKIVRIKNGVLTVRVPSSVWAMELSFFEKEIIYKMNNILGESIVKKIEFKEV